MNLPHEQVDGVRFLRSGEVASAAGVNVQTLRYYERRGLLAPPDRNSSGHRQYPPHTVTLVRMIRGARRFGLSLDEIATVIASDDASTSIGSIAKRKVGEIDAQIAELEWMRKALESYIH